MNGAKIIFNIIILSFSTLLAFQVCGQQIGVNTEDGGLAFAGYTDRNGAAFSIPDRVPLFSFTWNGTTLSTLSADIDLQDNAYSLSFGDSIACGLNFSEGPSGEWKCRLKFQNLSEDTIEVENIVPFGESPEHIYITSTGPWALARAKLFRPGFGPVGVILPDNAWEMGYAQVDLDGSKALCAIARRTGIDKGEYRRYKSLLFPGGTLEYTLYADDFQGEWQDGLKMMFHERYLYDLEDFDNTLFDREDLKWIRHKYMIGLEFAWNRDFYDWQRQQYHYFSFLEKGLYYFGGYDVFGLWPTWPRLGVDERNQWDLFSDMPGGLEQLRFFSREGKKAGTSFFICYNPWDESTRKENPFKGMATLIDALDADGVVLDCHGWSSADYQHAADSIKPGVIMYSEGMAIVKDMPGIVSGRVHNAIYLAPPLNLNKLIKPEFAIFRVCELKDESIHREVAIAFFNGYGTELNTFAPGQFDHMEKDLLYLGRTIMTLRENSSSFISNEWTPLIHTSRDSIWVNRWPREQKTIFTVLSFVPEGYHGTLFEEKVPEGFHCVSIWHHEELDPVIKDGKSILPVKLEAFNRYDLGNRYEGNVDCLAILPEILEVSMDRGILKATSNRGDQIRIWAGMPNYQNLAFINLEPGSHEITLRDVFGRYEGKIVVQLLDNNELMDERVVYLETGQPRLISRSPKSNSYRETPEGMVRIPAGTFTFSAENTDQFIPYPDTRDLVKDVPSFYMDKYPVTNLQFLDFLTASSYIPGDTTNFLKHWQNGRIPKGMESHPVVYVSLEDAMAYADWAGKRLPTEVEWQYAGQGSDGRKWPWGNEFKSNNCNNASGLTTPVTKYTRGKSPFGVMDMIGNVWQYTSDVYDNGTYYYVIMKGGSHYKPTSSWWYVKGGPQPLDWHQQLLLVSPGFDRNSTVGFRCAADIAE